MMYPKITMTMLWHWSKRAFSNEVDIQQAFMEQAELVMEEAYPSRLNDKELIFLSYKLPWPLALALLRHRLVLGLALRERAGHAP